MKVSFRYGQISPDSSGINYNIDGSMATISDVSYSLFRHFKYEISMNLTREKKFSYFPDIPIDKWKKYLRDEINADRPVLYSSTFPEEYDFYLGHVYVIDGYDDLENFHINWGWDGSSNGYYSLGNFLTFNDYEQMILQINPDYEATDDWQKLNLTDGSGGSYMNGGELDPIIIDFEDLEKGKDYTVTYPCILIDRDAEFTEVILALTNKEGTIKESWPVWSIEEKLINDNPPGSNLQISTSIRISSNLGLLI